MNDKELLEGYGFQQTTNDKGVTLFTDELHGYNFWMDEQNNFAVNHPNFQRPLLLDMDVLKSVINFNNPTKELDHIVIIHGEVTLSNTKIFPSGSKKNEYYIKYKSGSIKINDWGDKPLFPKGSQLGVIGVLKQDRYEDKNGEWKTTDNYIHPMKIEKDVTFTINTQMINEYEEVEPLPF